MGFLLVKYKYPEDHHLYEKFAFLVTIVSRLKSTIFSWLQKQEFFFMKYREDSGLISTNFREISLVKYREKNLFRRFISKIKSIGTECD